MLQNTCHIVLKSISKLRRIKPNGPAIWGGCVTRRSIRAVSWYPAPAGPKNCHGARRVRRSFCHHGTNLIAFWRDRGTSMIGAASLSPVTNFLGSTGAVSRYKDDRSRKTIKVYWILLRADERVRVQETLQNCLECRN